MKQKYKHKSKAIKYKELLFLPMLNIISTIKQKLNFNFLNYSLIEILLFYICAFTNCFF